MPINDGQILRFQSGGKIKIIAEGGTEEEVLNIIDGSVNETPTFISPLPPDIHQGEPLVDIRKGDKQPGSVSFDVKYGSASVASALVAFLTDQTDTQVSKKFQIDIERYTNAARTEGNRTRIVNAVVSEPPAISTGSEYDQIRVAFVTPSDFIHEQFGA